MRPGDGRPVVLFSTGPLKPTDNPYLHLLVDGVAEEVQVRHLTPLTALFGRIDILHVHWPHQLVLGASRWRSWLKLVTSWLLLVRVRLRRTPVVRTVHNLGSHEGAGLGERGLTRRLDRMVTARVYLNESEENHLAGADVVALHPHYRSWLAGRRPVSPPPAAGDVLLFGNLRPYKGIEELIEASGAAGVRATVAGRPLDGRYGESLRQCAASVPGVRLLPGEQSEEDLLALLAHHDLVVLPYRRMYNSGALLYALSVGVPVLAPDSPANRAIRAEVGDWVLLYDPPLTPAVLRDALDTARATERRTPPPLERRDPAAHGAIHRDLYRSLLGR